MTKCFLFFIFLARAPLWAQVPPQEVPAPAKTQAGVERVEALKVTYIAQHLNLTPAEAARFWPIFNQYQNELYRTAHDRSMDELARETAIITVKNRYQAQFTTVIGRNRSLYVFQTEHEFNQMLIHRFVHPNPAARLAPRHNF